MQLIKLENSNLDKAYLIFKELRLIDVNCSYLSFKEDVLVYKENEHLDIFIEENYGKYVGVYLVRNKLINEVNSIEVYILANEQNKGYATVGMYRLFRMIRPKDIYFKFQVLKENKKMLQVLLTNKAKIIREDKNFYYLERRSESNLSY